MKKSVFSAALAAITATTAYAGCIGPEIMGVCHGTKTPSYGYSNSGSSSGNNGSVTMYDQNGNYLYGTTSGGSVTMYDQIGNYYYGTNNGGNITLYDQNGNYYHGYVGN